MCYICGEGDRHLGLSDRIRMERKKKSRKIMKSEWAYVLSIMTLLSCQEREARNVGAKTDSVPFLEVPTEKTHGLMLHPNNGCSFNHEGIDDSLLLYYPAPREIDEIRKIVTYSGLPLNFEIYAAKIDNAVATIVNNKRLIIYDPSLLRNTDKLSNSYWASMSILAHEIGHHLSGHTLSANENHHQMELEADKFSGFVLYKMGATLQQATAAMTLLGSERESFSHPDRVSRLEAIKAGWEESSQLRYEGAIPPPPDDLEINGIVEFDEGNLLDSDSYDESYRNFTKFGIADPGLWLSEKWEGVLTEVNYDSSGGAICEVFVTKIGKNEYYGKDFVGSTSRIQIELDDPSSAKKDWSNVELSWLNAVLKPGRRIRFGFVVQGSGSFCHFGYIKALPGSSY